MSLVIDHACKEIEKLREDKQFFSANDIRKKYPHLPEGIIINALIKLKREGKIEKYSRKNWRWIK